MPVLMMSKVSATVVEMRSTRRWAGGRRPAATSCFCTSDVTLSTVRSIWSTSKPTTSLMACVTLDKVRPSVQYSHRLTITMRWSGVRESMLRMASDTFSSTRTHESVPTVVTAPYGMKRMKKNRRQTSSTNVKKLYMKGTTTHTPMMIMREEKMASANSAYDTYTRVSSRVMVSSRYCWTSAYCSSTASSRSCSVFSTPARASGLRYVSCTPRTVASKL
mmetsp:Transcript_42622/g.107762  ORF Transcript_42622/g.107762 Transcript_42622/m.107762 type:complete len:219 (+) Transcript_42622:480-1136(+)